VVRTYLQGKRVNVTRMHTTGIGGERLIKTNDTQTGRAANRRIEFELRK
jgi:outer membrane protein OmpA-like peptidoglycan-associated protein